MWLMRPWAKLNSHPGQSDREAGLGCAQHDCLQPSQQAEEHRPLVRRKSISLQQARLTAFCVCRMQQLSTPTMQQARTQTCSRHRMTTM